MPVQVIDAGECAEAVERCLQVLHSAEQHRSDCEADAVEGQHLGNFVNFDVKYKINLKWLLENFLLFG